MTADHFAHLDQFGADLWKLADQLRANSGLASNEYFMPILGLLFLRHASNRYYAAREAIAANQAAGRMPKRPLRDADFTQRRAMNLPEAARYDVILERPKDGSLGHPDGKQQRGNQGWADIRDASAGAVIDQTVTDDALPGGSREVIGRYTAPSPPPTTKPTTARRGRFLGTKPTGCKARMERHD